MIKMIKNTLEVPSLATNPNLIVPSVLTFITASYFDKKALPTIISVPAGHP